MPDYGAANEAACAALVRAFEQAGVEHACLTPGSRNTPLTLAFAAHGGVRPWLHLDERSAAFFALGIARATRRPAVLACTSGTAAANYLPAVVEANLSRIPLIVCTADRPPRLRDRGADQTMAQVGMFGSNVRWATDLPVPGGDPGEPGYFANVAARAVRSAAGPLPGPVHLNLPFEEPLIASGAFVAPAVAPVAFSAEAPRFAPTDSELRSAAEAIAAAKRPLIVAGPELHGDAAAIARLADAIDAPIAADPLSGLRRGRHDRSRVLDSFDAVLRSAPGDPSLQPDCIIRFGAKPTSKALSQFIARQSGATHLLCDLPGGWRDPDAVSSLALTGDAMSAANALASAVDGHRSDRGWSDGWLARDRRARAAMQSTSEPCHELFEGRVFSELAALLPEGATILAGNSMPVRDLDSFLSSGEQELRLVANRGAAGIDGVTSTALGMAAVSDRPVVLVIGDISFYHDLNGLWAASRHGLNLTVVLINNNGGGIFHYLPQASHPEVFEEWFGTPPNLDFSHAVAMYGGSYTAPRDWDAFRSAIAQTSSGGLQVVELATDRAKNVEMHRAAWAAAAAALVAEAGV